MKAPDKIYGEVNDNGFVCGYAEPTKSDDIEYIRKDALLDWAKGFTEPKIFVSTLLDKLNSM